MRNNTTSKECMHLFQQWIISFWDSHDVSFWAALIRAKSFYFQELIICCRYWKTLLTYKDSSFGGHGSLQVDIRKRAALNSLQSAEEENGRKQMAWINTERHTQRWPNSELPNCPGQKAVRQPQETPQGKETFVRAQDRWWSSCHWLFSWCRSEGLQIRSCGLTQEVGNRPWGSLPVPLPLHLSLHPQLFFYLFATKCPQGCTVLLPPHCRTTATLHGLLVLPLESKIGKENLFLIKYFILGRESTKSIKAGMTKGTNYIV